MVEADNDKSTGGNALQTQGAQLANKIFCIYTQFNYYGMMELANGCIFGVTMGKRYIIQIAQSLSMLG